VKLYISDLDGTLLNSRQVISNESLATINGLVADHGLPFTLATARSIHSAWQIVKDLKLKHPIILNNGVFIYDPVTKTNLAANLISPDIAGQVVRVIQDHGLHPIAYMDHPSLGGKAYYQGIHNPGEQDYIQARIDGGDKRFTLTPDYGEILSGEITVVIAIDLKERIDTLHGELRKRFDLFFHSTRDIYSGYQWLEITHPAANKREGVRFLKRLLVADRTACFGDNLNDLPMFQECDECYAVTNACEESNGSPPP
jgi:5-amino-6-(5-phospho-D-ribitylamino)uracil phosphatase